MSIIGLSTKSQSLEELSKVTLCFPLKPHTGSFALSNMESEASEIMNANRAVVPNTDLKTVLLKGVNASMLSSFCLICVFFQVQVNEGKKKRDSEILGSTHLIQDGF